MRRVSNLFEAMSLGIVILIAIFGVVQAEDPYQVVIVGDAPPHLSSVVVGAGQSVDMRVVILNVTDPVVAGSSLYLNYDPQVISSISCVRSIYKESNSSKEVQPGRYLIEGYDTFGKYTGDVIIAILRLTANASAPVGSSSDLKVSGQRLGASLGTPVWGPFWQVIETPLENGKLTIGESGSVAGIQVNKTVNPNSGSPSTNATFNITVSNTGTADLNNVTVTDILPDGMSYVSSSPVAENVSGGVVTWNDIGPLLSNSSPVSLELVAHVDQGASGDLVNSVEATGYPEQGGAVTSTATANFTALEAGIQVNKTVYPRAGAPSTNATFNITVSNTGIADLNNVTVTDILPDGMSYVSSSPVAENVSGGVVTWNDIGPLLSNSSPVSLELVAHVDQGASGDLVNSVEAIGKPEQGGVVTSTATANFTALEAGIQVHKIACPKVVGVMFPVTFIIQVKNTGEIALDNVTLKDILPPGMIFLSSSPHGKVNASRKVAWDLGAMEPQETRLIELVAKVGFRAGDTLRNEVVAEGSNISSANVSSSAFATVNVDRKLNMAYIAG